MLQRARRDVVNWLLGVGAAGWIGSVLHPLLQYVIPPRIPEARISSIKLGKVEEFPLGSSKIIKFGSTPALLIRSDKGEWHAYSAVCTHLNCTVQYRSDWKVIWCACHDGRYDLNGKNISGPPPRPLELFKVIVQNNEVYLSREA